MNAVVGSREGQRAMLDLVGDAIRYGAASAIALLADAGLLLALTRYGGLHYLLAATISFMAGATIAYGLSVRFVFHAHRLHNRELEFLSFVLIGLAGLGVNVLVLSVAHGRLGMDLLAAKAVAAGFTFLTNFGLRRQLLFRAGASAS